MSDKFEDEVQAAFPDRYRDGMTLRDFFAAKALGGLINYSPEPYEHESIARLCYSLADAMLKAREA